jgi:hypothetical protein
MIFPGKITAQGAALAPIAVATRPQGAPLTVILTGKTAAPPRERARAKPTPRAQTTPRPFPAEAPALVVISPRLTPPSRHLASRLTIPARAEAWRWRAEGAPLKRQRKLSHVSCRITSCRIT